MQTFSGASIDALRIQLDEKLKQQNDIEYSIFAIQSMRRYLQDDDAFGGYDPDSDLAECYNALENLRVEILELTQLLNPR